MDMIEVLVVMLVNNLLWFMFVYIMLPDHRFTGTKKINIKKPIKQVGKMIGIEKEPKIIPIEELPVRELKKAILKGKS